MRIPAFRYDWRWHLDATPEALWPLIADTNRFNRDTGLPPVEVVSEGPRATRTLRFTRLGVVVEWEERPFEWVRPRRFGVVRRYARGPVAEMRVRVMLDPDGSGGTRLRYVTAIRPRNAFGVVATAAQVGVLSRRAFDRVFRRYAELAKEPSRDRLVEGAPDAALASGAKRRIAKASEELIASGHHPSLVHLLGELLERGDDLTLARIRPYALADAWSAGRRDVLTMCMAATRLGLLDLRWDLLCPLCRGTKATAGSLDQLRGSVHCDTCNIDFAAEFERAVELTFHPNPVIRSAEAPAFCVAGPQVTPHVTAQQLIEPGGTRRLALRLEAGRHRLRSLDGQGACYLRVAEEGASRLEVARSDAGWSPAEADIAPDCEITVVNRTDDEQLVVLERTAWSDDAATAAEVTALQVFRDLFSSEVLASGEFRSVGRLAVLFTDLRDSTQLYRRIGDAPAYGRVQRHFDVLRDAVTRHDGAVVKTIGDAVMAVFQRPVRALEAILEAQARLGGEAGTSVVPLVLKAGIHYGPCIAVNLDDRLDYFGTVVNVAARLDKLSNGGDVVISDAMRQDPEVEALLEARGLLTERFTERIRGVEDLDFELWRVRELPAENDARLESALRV